jgi:steroid 5-alpha reductase family enzyme
MTFLPLWLYAGITILIAMTSLWLVSLAIKNASIVDIFWGTGFVITYWAAAWINPAQLSAREILLGILVSLWGLRLSIYIFSRNHAQPEDFRYAAWRTENGSAWWWRSFFKVFLLQGVILWIVITPLIATQTGSSTPLTVMDLSGAALWLVGFIFEAGGDWQLSRFKKDPANKGKLLTTGLWSLTRHPNYFGDAAQWWGFYLIAFASGAWWTIFSPFLMTFLLMKVSGVAMLERTLTKTKPGYETYVTRTSEFFPWFPKK